MEYRGYTGRATYDAEVKVWFGEVENLRDVVTFEAKEEPEVESAFRASVDDYLDMLAARSSSSSDERSVHPSDAELSRRQRCDARLESDAVPAFDADGESRAPRKRRDPISRTRNSGRPSARSGSGTAPQDDPSAPSPEDVASDKCLSEWCMDCDGCGWNEGSPAYTCHTCKGTGVKP